MDRIKQYMTPANAAVLAGAVILLIILCVPIGVANNGDFDRVVLSGGLEYISDPDARYFDYVDEHYRIGFRPDSSVHAQGLRTIEPQAKTMQALGWFQQLQSCYITTHMVPVWLTVLASALFTDIYSIQVLGTLYGLLLLLALWLGVGGIAKRYGNTAGWFAAALGVFMFCDIGYLSYFNSFYGEAASYVFLLLAAGAFIALLSREKPKMWHMVLYFIGTIMFVGSKQQNVFLVIFFLGISIRLFFLYREKCWRWVNAVLSGVMILVSASTMVSVSDVIYEINIHQAVFIGILELSDNPAADLQELGLSEELEVMAGHTYYENDVPYPPNSEYMRTEFFDKISYGKIIRYYLCHPDKLWAAMERTAADSFEVMQPYLGSYPASIGYPPGTQAKSFAVYDNLRNWALGSNSFPLWIVLLTYLVAAAILIKNHMGNTDKRQKALMEFLAIIMLIGVFQFAMPYIADGWGDLSKHLFLFNMATDILFFAAITAGAAWFVQILTANRYKNKLKLIKK